MRGLRPLSRLDLALALAATLLAASCGFRDLRRNLEAHDRFGVVRGWVSADDEGDAPLLVVVSGGTPEHVFDVFALTQAGQYFFVLPAGTYKIAAFVDRDGDLTYRPAQDPSGRYPQPITLTDGSTVADVDVHVAANNPSVFDIPVSVSREGVRGVPYLPDFNLGVVTDLDDPRFSEANAANGLWRPVDFIFQVGAGIYFLEPYDPAKIPVVFVHGALGHPGNWRYLIEHLDRARFQPWLVYYPTAAGLGAVVESLDRWLRWLAVVHGFEHYAIVAHSMGGLVARGYVNGLASGSSLGAPDVLVTIATPWLGHASAAVGVRRAPVVAPSWFDMAPGSPFLNALFAQPLPDNTAFDLLFAYGGSPRRGPSNDGVVTLASQLPAAAQFQAQRVFGVDAGHMAVLSDADTAQELNALLATMEP